MESGPETALTRVKKPAPKTLTRLKVRRWWEWEDAAMNERKSIAPGAGNGPVPAGMSTVGRLPGSAEIPEAGILSRPLLSAPGLRVVWFGLGAGQELTEHTATRRAWVQGLSGSGEFQLAGRWHALATGVWIHLEPGEPHAVRAATPLSFLLVLAEPPAVPPGPTPPASRLALQTDDRDETPKL